MIPKQKTTEGKVHDARERNECSNKRTKEPAAKVGSLEDPKRWRRTTQDEVQSRRDSGAWETRFLILPNQNRSGG